MPDVMTPDRPPLPLPMDDDITRPMRVPDFALRRRRARERGLSQTPWWTKIILAGSLAAALTAIVALVNKIGIVEVKPGWPSTARVEAVESDVKMIKDVQAKDHDALERLEAKIDGVVEKLGIRVRLPSGRRPR